MTIEEYKKFEVSDEDSYTCPECKEQCPESKLLEDEYAQYKGFSDDLFCPNCKARVE